MQLTKGQEEAIKVCVERYKNKEPYTVIAGYSGVGKSTVVSYIINALNIDESRVVYAAFTGKASLVLREKGCTNAMTLHKLLYIPKPLKNTDSVEFIPRTHLEDNPKLIVVDEASMLRQDMFDLLLSHKVHMILLGDPFQLPPVGNDAVNLLNTPHVMLTEITRQAQDSPIIRLSMDIRNGKPLSYGGESGVKIISKDRMSKNLLLGADMIVTGRNDTRRYINEQVRKLKWGNKYQDAPIEGDTLTCLKNQWQITDQSNEVPLLNGTIGVVDKISTKETKALHPKLMARFIDEMGNVFDKNKFNIDYQLLTTGTPTVNSNNFKEFYNVQRPVEFDYAYAITAHRSQGSQWNNVLVFAEQMGNEEYFRKWLYTSCTRSVERCIIMI